MIGYGALGQLTVAGLRLPLPKASDVKSLTEAQAVTIRFTAGRTFSVTQGQAVTSSTKTVARTFARTQDQGVTVSRAMTRSYTVTQNQAVTVASSRTRTFSVSGSQTPTRSGTVARAMVTTQSAAPTRGPTTAQREFRATQAQATSHATARSASYSLTQATSPAVGGSASRTVVVSQAATPSRSGAISRTLAVAGGQGTIVGRSLARALSATQSAAVSLAAGTLATVRSATQAAAASVRAAVARELPVSQAAAVTTTRSQSTTRSLAQGQSPALVRQVSFELALSQAAAGATRYGVHRGIAATQDAVVQIATAVARSSISTQASAVSFVRDIACQLAVDQLQLVHVGAPPPPGVLVVEQLQAVTYSSATARSFSSTQPSTLTLLAGLSRAVSVTQAAGVAVPMPIGGTRTFTTTQNQAVTLGGPPAPTTATFTVTQDMGTSVGGAITRQVVVTQAQLDTLTRSVAATRSATQSAGGSLQCNLNRVVMTTQVATPAISARKSAIKVAAQSQAVARGAQVARRFTVAQSQARRLTRAVARALAAVQSQAVSLRRDVRSTVSAAQDATVAMVGVPVHAMNAVVTQGQAVVRRLAVSRTLRARQSAAARTSKDIRRMMEVAGAQSGSFTGSHGKRLAITVGQTGSAAITSRAQRIARARQSATATATGSVSASKRARQRQAARVGRALPRTFAVAQDQTAAVGVRRASVVYAAGPQAVGLLARADRTFASAQASGTLVSFVLPGRLFSAEQAQRTWLEWPKVPARIDVTGEADGLVVTLHPEMTTRSTSPAISVAGRADGVAITGRTPGRSSSGAGRVVVTAKVRRPVVENVGEIVVSERRNVETQVRPSGRIAVKEERP